MTGTVKILATRAIQAALPQLIADFERATGAQVAVELGPTNKILTRITDGERGDVAILSHEGIGELGEAGIVDASTAADLVRSVVGLAVKAGAPRPDIATAEALKAALLGAQSICYSSGFFGKAIKQLGIADAVNAKATVIPTGLAGELVARGQVEMAVQQMSELKAVPGLDIVGPLPATLQSPAVLAAAVFADTAQADLARALLHALTSTEAAAAYAAAGLEPVK